LIVDFVPIIIIILKITSFPANLVLIISNYYSHLYL